MAKVKAGMVIAERYEILTLIGSGGTADVFKAKDRRLNRNVAIKILKESFTGDKKIVDKFRQEAQSCAGLTHPNIVSVYDVGNDGSLYYIVMELIEGITLKRFIERKGKLEVKEAIGIAIQIAQGLDAAHANHVVHRDIKPQNIIISREGKVKVTDFGIARATQGTNSNTINNQAAVGSVHYLSPEQARGGFSDERSDIYSLGVTIYEMLAGKVPFSGDNNVSVALLHIQGEATPLHEINPDVTPSVEKIVVKCMQKKPERRYFSAAELIKDLKASINDPSGSFVKLGKSVVSTSPTREMSREEVDIIKNNAHNFDVEEEPQELEYDEDDEDAEDYELDNVNTKTEKFIIIGSVLLVIILIAFVALVFSKLDIFNSQPSTQTEETKTLSDSDRRKLLSYDYSLSEMKEALEKAGIKDYYEKGTYSDDIALNKVINLYYEDDSKTLTVEYSQGPVPPNTAIMGSVIGYSIIDAKKKLNEISDQFVVEIVASEKHTKDTVNTIIEQSVEEGKAVPFNQKIVLTYSIGPDSLVIGEYSGMTKDEIETMLGERFDLQYAYDMENNYSIDKANMVVKTDPAAGEKITEGATITVYLSSEYVEVPDVRNRSQADATNRLHSVGLRYVIKEVVDETVAMGTVTNQNIRSGEKVERGSVIELTVNPFIEVTDTPTPTPTPEVSETPTPTVTPTSGVTNTPTPTPYVLQMPNFYRSEKSEAEEELSKDEYKNLGIQWAFKENKEHDDNVPEGFICGQSPAAGAFLKKNERIILFVNPAKTVNDTPTPTPTQVPEETGE